MEWVGGQFSLPHFIVSLSAKSTQPSFTCTVHYKRRQPLRSIFPDFHFLQLTGFSISLDDDQYDAESFMILACVNYASIMLYDYAIC